MNAGMPQPTVRLRRNPPWIFGTLPAPLHGLLPLGSNVQFMTVMETESLDLAGAETTPTVQSAPSIWNENSTKNQRARRQTLPSGELAGAFSKAWPWHKDIR